MTKEQVIKSTKDNIELKKLSIEYLKNYKDKLISFNEINTLPTIVNTEQNLKIEEEQLDYLETIISIISND